MIDASPPRDSSGCDNQILTSLAAPVYTCDADGRILSYNEAAAELWGRRPVPGQERWTGAWRIFDADGSPLESEGTPVARALAEGRPIRGIEVIIERPDGSRRTILPHPEPIRDETGAITGVVNLLVDITERKEFERARALLASIVESSHDAIISESLDGTITSWNRGAHRLFGYAAGEAVGRHNSVLIPQERLSEEEHILERVLGGEAIDHFQTVRMAKDGRPIDVSLTVSPIRGPDGRLIGVSKVARDINDQQRTESARSLLAAIVESSDDAIISKTLDGIITSWNQGAQRIFGYTAPEIIGKPVTTLIPRARLAEEAHILGRLRRGERIDHFETVRVTKDGREIDISLTVSPVRDGAGRLVGASKVARDVTAQLRAERAVAESEARQRTLLALLPVGIYACDAAGRITFFNRRAVELWGREPGPETRYDGSFLARQTDGTPIPPERSAAATALREGRSFRDLEIIVERPDGSSFPAALSLDAVRSERGEVLGLIAVIQDISVQVAARKSLTEHQQRLEAAVAERTAELEASHRQLRNSERMAALGTLSAGLGHDMGNLLLPVRVSLEVLAAAELPEGLRTEVDRIRTSAKYLQQLASGLRMMALDPDLARKPDPLHVGAWWADAGLVIKNALPRGVALDADIAEDAWIAISRPALTQIVFNLAQNAGEALRGRPDGVVRATIRPEGDRVVITFQDNGPGMTREVLDRCMEPFFTTKSRGISTGLGLVLVAGLTREAGGEVAIESEPGRGTTFRLTFPAASAPGRAPAGPRGRALVDLHDARLRAVVTAELRHLDFDVLEDAGGAAPDLAVTDHGPPFAVEPGQACNVVLFAEASTASPHILAIGERPRPESIRVALRTAAGRKSEVVP